MVPRRAILYLTVAWVVLMLYPDPGMLLRSVRNTASPQVQPEAVAALARSLPDDPRAVEAHVLERLVPYEYDWQSVGVPWYFATTEEALAAGSGDCESRAVVLASILTAKGIPHELRVSFGHIWVDYAGKPATALENPAVQIAGVEDGEFFIRWPEDFRLGDEISDQLAIHWTPAPVWRLLLLVAGASLILLWNPVAARSGAGRLDSQGLLHSQMRPPARGSSGARAESSRPGRRRRRGGSSAPDSLVGSRTAGERL
jgi:hypothetical protein